MATNKILVLDIETTALKPSDGHIVEIGIVGLDTTTLELTDVFHSIICEEPRGIDWNAWIFHNSDLTIDLVVQHGKSLIELRSQLQKLFDENVCVAYNGQFDFNWLRSRKFQISKIGPDPMYIYQNILKIPGFYGDYKWPKVTECMRHVGFTETEPHRAYGDALIEARLIKWLIEHGHYSLAGVN